MKTWLFTWNPRLWSWNDPVYGYQEMIKEANKYGFSFCKWTCGVNKSIQKGDRIFLIRLGEEPRGMIASGYAITNVFEGTHWDKEKAAEGKTARRVYIEFDKILDCSEKILSMDELKRISDSMKWSSQVSGISIPEDVAKLLEQKWEVL